MGFNLVPKEEKFFDFLGMQAENLMKAAEFFKGAIKDGKLDEEETKKIHALEHEGDRLDARDRALGELGAAPWGTTLRYGVRLRDRRGRPSPLVVSEELVLSEPTGAPRN